jgi:hypothetical protein
MSVVVNPTWCPLLYGVYTVYTLCPVYRHGYARCYGVYTAQFCRHGVFLGSHFCTPIAFSRYLVLGAQYIHRVYVENYGELSITLYVQRSILGVYLGSHLLNPHSYPELCKPDGTYAVFIW